MEETVDLEIFKIILLGNYSNGKTTLRHRICYDQFNRNTNVIF